MIRGRHGRDHMVVRFTTTYAISAYLCESWSGRVYNIMWLNLSVICNRSVVFSGSSSFPHQ